MAFFVVPPEGGQPAVGRPRRQDGDQPGGVLGGVLGGQLGGTAVATKKDPTASTAPKPFAVVAVNAIYKPEPDKNALQGTKAAMFDKRPCTNETAFCVDTDGKTVDVKTKKKCYDAKVDEICRDTIKKWRFRPFLVGGKPQKTCSIAEFNFTFKG